MASDLWHYVKEGKNQDPVPWNVLVQMARAGKIGPYDQVWNENLPRWVPASAVEGLLTPIAGGVVYEAGGSSGSNTWIGILSLAMGLFFCFAEMALVLIAGMIEASSPGRLEDESAEAIALGLLLLGGGAGAFIGAIVGMVALFMDNANKVIAAFGVATNGMCVIGIVLLMLIGLVAG